ncbi:MAG TPA: serine/threonine-protein kinase, partial [Gemmataceae bacterium]|nr:serine/threonine-protein kinase [Gemmataceae bacterium]
MPAPKTIDELLDLGTRSGILEKQGLDDYLKKLRAAHDSPKAPRGLADAMVRDGLLTRFQAEQLLAGKWRNFKIAAKYKLLERLGAGGMGAVFLCEHVVMRRRVALKVLPAAHAASPAALERFHREARAAAALDHPNIVKAHDVDRDGPLHFLVMEYVDGASLHDIVKKHGPMDVVRACHYVAQAALGLDHAHRAGLVHRDIKPGNVLLDRAGTVKILDMGLARFFHDRGDNITKEHDSKAVLGTADYLAPEQAINSHEVDIRADIYSLGVTFYFLLTGTSPFAEGTLAQKLIWHQMRAPKAIREYRSDVPEELAAVIDTMMAKAPEERYQTPEEVVEALGPFVQAPVGPPPESEMPQLCPAAAGPLSMGPSSNPPPPGSSRKILQGSGLSTAVRTGPSTPLPKRTPSRASSADDVTEIIPDGVLAPPDDSDDKRRRRAFLLLAIGGGLVMLGSV